MSVTVKKRMPYLGSLLCPCVAPCTPFVPDDCARDEPSCPCALLARGSPAPPFDVPAPLTFPVTSYTRLLDAARARRTAAFRRRRARIAR